MNKLGFIIFAKQIINKNSIVRIYQVYESVMLELNNGKNIIDSYNSKGKSKKAFNIYSASLIDKALSKTSKVVK